jgi:probable F420-dependent oxidoreductase
MKFGYSLFGLGPRSFADVARAADQAGFESIWMAEHLVFPTEFRSTYPYSESGSPPVNPATQLYDPWVSLAYMAAVTTNIRLGTNVYILPLRSPLVTARALVTLDRLSGGRVLLGAGVGWLEEEFKVAGENWQNRGKRTDEIIEILRKLWAEPTIEHHGAYYDFGPVKFEPKPVQKPVIPIHIGGETPPARRRAARLGDGWLLAGGRNAPERARELVVEMRELRAAAGRGDAPFEITMGSALPITLENVQRYAEAGVDRLILNPPWPPDGRLTVPHVQEFIARVSQEVIGKLS